MASLYYRSAEEVVDGKSDFRKGDRRNEVISLQFERSAVVAAAVISINQQQVFFQILDPNLRNSRFGIKGNLHVSIIGKRSLRNLNNQQNISRRRSSCGIEIRTRLENNKIRLQFGAPV